MQSVLETNKLKFGSSLCPNKIMRKKLKSTPGGGALVDAKVHL